MTCNKETIWCIVDSNDNAECKHIFGYEESMDEAWLVFKPDPKAEVVFNYCPLCGCSIRYLEGVWAE